MARKKKPIAEVERTFKSLWSTGEKHVYEVQRANGGWIGVCEVKGVILKSRVVNSEKKVEDAMFAAIYEGISKEARQASDKMKLERWNSGCAKHVSSEV